MSPVPADHDQCVRSGMCCGIATCVLGMSRGAEPKGCQFLKGDGPGQYSCKLINNDPSLGDAVAIGGRCSSAMFNEDRDTILRAQGLTPRWRETFRWPI